MRDSGESGYTIKDLCEIAKARGVAVSPRLVLDWIELGLLDQTKKLYLGRRGRKGLFPEEQLHLFLALLEHRGKLPHRGAIPAMCNIPVFIWLYWGDQYVPLRQVRRVLATWGKGVLSHSWSGARKNAREVLRKLNPPSRARGRRAFIEALTRTIYQLSSGGQPAKIDWNALVAVVQRVLGVSTADQPRGPMGAPVTAQSVVLLTRARLEAIVHLKGIDDSSFEWARFMYHTLFGQYLRERPKLATDPALGHLFTAPTPSDVFSKACLDLVTLLGLARLGVINAREDSLWHPQSWRALGLKSVGGTEVRTRDGFVVPFNGGRA